MLYLADANIQMDNPAEAESLLQKTIKANPSLPLAHLDLGILEAEAGRNDEAIIQLNAAEAITPDDVNVHWRLARLYRTMGKKEESKAEFDKASSLNQKADDSLFDKIQNGRAHPPPGQTDPQAEPKTGARDCTPDPTQDRVPRPAPIDKDHFICAHGGHRPHC